MKDQPEVVRIASVEIADGLTMHLADGRSITAPLPWFPKLARASHDARSRWELAGAGSGVHWPDIDEDISAEHLLNGACVPRPLRGGRG